MNSKNIVHKRGSANCGDYGDGGAGTTTATFQWKRVNCPKCIANGKKRIPKALQNDSTDKGVGFGMGLDD